MCTPESGTPATSDRDRVVAAIAHELNISIAFVERALTRNDIVVDEASDVARLSLIVAKEAWVKEAWLE